MTNAELIACIQAEERGEVVEERDLLLGDDCAWRPHVKGNWDTTMLEYRIAPKPRRCWVRWDEEGVPYLVPFLPNQNANDFKLLGWQLVEEAR